MTTPQESSSKSQSSAKLSPDLKAFYESHNVLGVEELFRDCELPMMRFVRLNPRYDKVETISLLEVSPACSVGENLLAVQLCLQLLSLTLPLAIEMHNDEYKWFVCVE